MFLCCLSSSALYGFGFVPGTLRYVKRTFDLGVYDRVGGDVYSVCDDIMKHEPLREKYDNEDTTYFLFYSDIQTYLLHQIQFLQTFVFQHN